MAHDSRGCRDGAYCTIYQAHTFSKKKKYYHHLFSAGTVQYFRLTWSPPVEQKKMQ